MKYSNRKIPSMALCASFVLTNVFGASPTQAHGVDSGSAITAAELQQKGYDYPSDLVAGANHTQFANYAWRLFIASMQNTNATLQNGSGRTIPSSVTNFISSGSGTTFSSPLVFESFYHRTEAFPYYATPSQKPPVPPIGRTPVYYTYFEMDDNTVPYTVSGAQYVNLDETNQIGQNFLYYRESNDPDFPVLFMAKVNASETNYVWDRSAPSNSSSFVFPDDVMEVKTAWRRVQDIKNSDPNKYHQAQATYYVANAQGVPHPVTEKFALIAIHIIQKTANYQQFIFTTFEHVDSTTRDRNNNITDPAYKVTYQNLAYDTSASPYTATPVGAYTYNNIVNSNGQPGNNPNVPTTYDLPVAGPISQGYTVITQPQTISSEVNDVNNQVGALIQSLDSNSIWANYRLKGVQAAPTNNQSTLDYYLANIVVESSQPGIQLFTGTLVNGGLPVDGLLTNNRSVDGSYSDFGPYANVSLGLVEGQPVPNPQYTMGGCQGCHGAAQQKGRDFSFLSQASGGKGKELDSVPASALNAAAVEAHNAKMVRTNNFNN